MSTYYVSATAANGIAAGNDSTGDGSIDHPWASIDKANAMAADGDTVMLNDGVYKPTADLRVANSVSWQGVTDYGATIAAAAGQSRVITIADERAGNVTFGKITIDAGNTAQSAIVLGDQTAPYTLELNGTRLVNPTRYGVQGSAATQANIITNDVAFSGANALTMVYIPHLMQGIVDINGGTVDIPGQWLAGYGGIATINADDLGTAVNISGVTANIVSTGGAGIHYGIRLTDVPKSLVEYNDITQSQPSNGESYIGSTVSVTYSRIEPLDASGGIIRYNTLRNFLPGAAGKIIMVGADADPGPGLHDNANDFEIYGNTGMGNAQSGDAVLHGILIGWQDGAKVYDNSMDYTSIAYVMKGMSGDTLVYNNTDTHTFTKSYYQKGGTGVDFLYNTSYQAVGFNPIGIIIGDTGVGQYPAHDATVVGNTVYYQGGSGIYLSLSPGSDITTLAGNEYFADGGNASNAFFYNGVKYKTLAAWQAAQESSATSAQGDVLGQGAILAAVGISGQALQRTGLVSGVMTYTITFVNGLSSSTSFAIGNFGASNAAAITGIYDYDDGGTAAGSSITGSGTGDLVYTSLQGGGQIVFTLNYDGLQQLGGQTIHVAGNYVNTPDFDIVLKSIDLTAPTISGSAAVQMSDIQTVSPFTAIAITDADMSNEHEVQVRIDQPQNGSFSTLAGFINLGGGLYSFTGTTGDAVAALKGLRFTPTANEVTPGASAVTTFTVTYANNYFTTTSQNFQTSALSLNDTPFLSGVVAQQVMLETATLLPFADAHLTDPDVGQTQTFTITFDKTTRGALTSLNGFVDNLDGSYTFVGTAAAADAALRQLVFVPTKYQALPGESTKAKVTLTVSDGISSPKASVSYITITAVETVPILAGATTSATVDTTAVKPFAGMTLADPDKAATETLVVRLDSAAKGSFTTLAGFTLAADGSYTYTGSVAAAQNALQNLVFTPTTGRLANGTVEAAQFTVAVSDGYASGATQTASVSVTGTFTAVNTVPIVSGAPANQAMSELATLKPFAAVTLADPDPGQTETVTVAFDKASRGTFSTLAGFVDNQNGSYTFMGSASAAQTALQSLVFAPAQHQVIPGTSSSAKMTVTVTDGQATSKALTTYVAVTAEETVPVLAGATTLNTTDKVSVKPFASMTLTDPDKSATETITVTLDDAAKGGFTTLAGFTAGANGSYSYTGTVSLAQKALQSLVFSATTNRLAQGQVEAVQFAINVNDGFASTLDTASKVLVTGTTVQQRAAA